MTQGFFLKLLHDDSFDAAQADKGRLRTFLLCSLDRHLADQLRREGAPPSYREVALKLEASETAVRPLVFRARAKFRELLRDEVARTVLAPEDVPGELEWLKSVLAWA